VTTAAATPRLGRVLSRMRVRVGRLVGGPAGPVAAGVAATALLAAGVVSLWVARPERNGAWLLLWAVVVGGGFAAAGCAAVARDRGSVPGRLFLAVAGLLLAAPPVATAAPLRAAEVLMVLATAVLVPVAVLRVVPPGPADRVLRGMEVLAVLAGLVSVTATVADAPVVGWAAGLACGVVVFCAGWVLFERSSGDERRQVLWVVLGVAGSVPPSALFLVAADTVPFGAAGIVAVVAALSLALPLSLAVAVLAPRALDVRVVIREAAAAAVMATLVVAAWGGVEAVLELLGEPAVPGYRGLLVLAIAAGFHPVLVRARALMDELLFGGRADPVDTLTRLGSELTAGSSPHDWLETLRAALGVPGIELRSGGDVVASSGTLGADGGAAAGRLEVTPLVTGAEQVGDLVVALPPDQLRPTPTTSAVLRLVAPPLAQALHAARLGEELRDSRRRVVAALEEERRRVRRDLHDGLGPTLTGIAYSADAATNLVTSDAEEAVRVLRSLRGDAREAIAEVRRIVYGLRPRSLDELGLVGAVRQRTSDLHSTGGRVLAVEVDAPGELPELSAAVEVAAFRVAVEAVTNVARHAAVDRATVTFALVGGTHLRVRVADAGASERPWRHGVGLSGMRERVEAVGGVLTVESGPAGAVVTADLPLGDQGSVRAAGDVGENGV
jgi:signal transduction histidine kinase